jgi:hypothetical protein
MSERKRAKATFRGVPNLDAMPRAELIAFAVHHARGENAQELLGADGPRARKVAEMLSAYAFNLESAQDARLSGEIEKALAFEHVADSIYHRLPKGARW